MKFDRNLTVLLAKATLKIVIAAIPTVLMGLVLIPYFIQQQISNKIVISPELNPELYAAWIQPPVPIYLKTYIFNVTNPTEVEAGMSPKFEEIGPYVFQETRTKKDVSLDDINDTATYSEQIIYHFNKKLNGSRQNLSDIVTLINVPFVAAAIKIQNDVPWPLNHVAHMVLLNYKEPLFIQKTVEEILFKGWKVPFLEKIESEIGLSMMENNTFSFFMGFNATNQGPYVINRGQNGDKQLFGKIMKYKNESRLGFWGEPESFCNQLQGTDGTIFPPNVNKDTVLRMFNPEMCASLYATFRDDTEFREIQGYRFTAPVSMYEDPRVSEQNRCYCPSIETSPEKCMKRGALDLGSCRDGAPVATSAPHFLGADPKYLSMVSEGLKPDREKHETFIDIEPSTGVLIRVSKKIQLNLILDKVPGISLLRNVNSMLFPLFWADEQAELDEIHADRLKSILHLIYVALSLSRWLSFVAFSVAIIFIFKELLSSPTFSRHLVSTDESKCEDDCDLKISDRNKCF